jgi:hypothetical protein
MAITDVIRDTINATGAALTYAVGQCTRFVAETLSWVPGGLGNAFQWFGNAQAKGLPTMGPSSSPPVGSVAVWGRSMSMPFGHVAEVIAQVPGGFQVREENFQGLGLIDTRTVTGGALGGLEGFILPPLGAAAGALGSGDPFGIGSAISGLPGQVGHGLANAATAGVDNLAAWAKNQIVPLTVALVVAVVIFAVPRD